jgi:hypothetical protein
VVNDAPPPIDDRGSSGGLVIVDQSTGHRVTLGLSIAGALLFGAFVAAVAGAVFFTIILFLITLAVSGFVIPRALEARAWHPAELHLPQSPLSLGSFSAAEFMRASKKSTKLDHSAQVHSELRCVESATYTVGTNSRTDTESIFEKRQTIDGGFTSGTYTASLPIQIPVDRGAPTMDVGNNEISWEIEIKGSGTALPKRGITFTLTVHPVLAVPDSLPKDVQDA